MRQDIKGIINNHYSMTVSETQMPICLSNSKERGRDHVVTTQNKDLVFRTRLSNCSVLCVGKKKEKEKEKEKERKSCYVLVHWPLDASSLPIVSLESSNPTCFFGSIGEFIKM
jgi:hypothetical protein